MFSKLKPLLTLFFFFVFLVVGVLIAPQLSISSSTASECHCTVPIAGAPPRVIKIIMPCTERTVSADCTQPCGQEIIRLWQARQISGDLNALLRGTTLTCFLPPLPPGGIFVMRGDCQCSPKETLSNVLIAQCCAHCGTIPAIFGGAPLTCPGALSPTIPTPTPAPTQPRVTPPAPPVEALKTLDIPKLPCAQLNPDCMTSCQAGQKPFWVTSCPCYCCGECGFNDIVNVFIGLASYLFGILGALALLFFIYGGVIWLMAGGSAEQIEKGKKILVGAVIGIAISLGAWLIIQFVTTALGVQPGFKVGF